MEDQDRRWGSGFEIEERQTHRDLGRCQERIDQLIVPVIHYTKSSHNAPERTKSTLDQSVGSPGVMLTYTPGGAACLRLALLFTISTRGFHFAQA